MKTFTVKFTGIQTTNPNEITGTFEIKATDALHAIVRGEQHFIHNLPEIYEADWDSFTMEVRDADFPAI